MQENVNSISESFSKSIVKNTEDIVLDAAEVVLDSIIDDEIIRDIPIIKYVFTAYKIVDDIKGRFFIRKLQNFVNNFNSGITTEQEIQRRRAEFVDGNRDRELAYIVVIVDRYLDVDKPAILAKFYLAYLDKTVSWNEFCSYSEVINMLLKDDMKYLIQQETYTIRNNNIAAELLRLSGTGLMNNYQNDSPFVSDGSGRIAVYAGSFDRVTTKERIFSRTDFGRKFVDIVNKY